MEFRRAISEGLTIRYVIRGSRGPYLLFIHGLGSRLEVWFPLWRELLKLGEYRLVALDLRGFGESGKPNNIPRLDDFATDVKAVLDDIGSERAVLVGTSMGGMVAVRVYTRNPSMVEALVLSNIATRVRIDLELLTRALMGDSDAMQRIVARVSKRLSRSGSNARNLFSGDTEYIVSVAEKLLEEDLSLELAWIKAPTLLIAGEQDPVTPPSEVARITYLVENSEYRVVSGASHLSHIDNPREYVRYLHDFLSNVTH